LTRSFVHPMSSLKNAQNFKTTLLLKTNSNLYTTRRSKTKKSGNKNQAVSWCSLSNNFSEKRMKYLRTTGNPTMTDFYILISLLWSEDSLKNNNVFFVLGAHKTLDLSRHKWIPIPGQFITIRFPWRQPTKNHVIEPFLLFPLCSIVTSFHKNAQRQMKVRRLIKYMWS
jgi:hypothetical protein